MNYHRKQWEKTRKNPIAKELREPKYRPKVIPPKKINLKDIEKYIDDE